MQHAVLSAGVPVMSHEFPAHSEVDAVLSYTKPTPQSVSETAVPAPSASPHVACATQHAVLSAGVPVMSHEFPAHSEVDAVLSYTKPTPQSVSETATTPVPSPSASPHVACARHVTSSAASPAAHAALHLHRRCASE